MLPVVPVQRKLLADYAEPGSEESVERLREAARPLAGARVLHVNSTAFGGGVAELLHTHVPLMNELGVETVWTILEGTDEYFAVTKAIHNALQGAEHRLTEEMQKIYWERIRTNAEQLPRDFDFVWIHDPQPAGLLQAVQEEGGRSGRWVWRCHIDLSAPYRPVWELCEPVVNRFDVAVFTAEEYVQPGIVETALIPPSIDPISLKNAPMSEEVSREIVDMFALDLDRPILTQVSRFDPWKDPLGVIDAYRMVRKDVPGVQLALIGSLAHDDPEGMRYLELTTEHADGDPDVHVLTNLDGVGDTAVNALQRVSDVIVQKSLREGFGLVVAEAMWKGKPVVGANVGGIRLQIQDGVCGFLVDTVQGCAERIVELLRDPHTHESMGVAGRIRVRERFLSLREVEDQLRLMSGLA